MWKVKSAFTLLELLVVITLVALITSMVSVRMGSLAAKARLQLAVDQLRFLDTQSRSFAERHGRAVSVQFEPEARRVTRRQVGSEDFLSPPLILPTGVSLTRVVRESSAVTSHPLVVGPLGRSESYALRLSAHQDRVVRWLVVAGMTGQASTLEEDDAAERIFSAW